MSQRLVAVGIAVIAILIAIFAFIQQQGAAKNEATAIASAHTAATAQSEAEANQQTAVFQMNDQATGQANAQSSESTAVAGANAAMTAQAQAEATRAAADQSAQESAATAAVALNQADQQAELAAQSQAEADDQAATAAALQTTVTAQSNQLATRQSLATSSAATATRSAAELGATVAMQATDAANLVATAESAQAQAADGALTATNAYSAAQATVSSLEAQVAIPVAPEDTINFLVQQTILPEFSGSLATRLGTFTVDLSGKPNTLIWQKFTGSYRDFVVKADMTWGTGAREDSCDLVFRHVDDNNHFLIGINRLGHVFSNSFMNGAWEDTEPYTDSPQIHTFPGETNQMMIIGMGTTFTVYLNGQLVITYNHAGFPEGQVAIAAGSDSGLPGAGCTFRNEWVWDLSSQSLTTPTLAVPSATPFPVPLLSGSYTTKDGALTFDYPSRWQITDTTGGVILYTKGFTQNDFSAIQSGEMGLLISHIPSPGDFFDPDSFMKFVTDGLSNGFANQIQVTFGEPESLVIGGRKMSRSIGISPQVEIQVLLYSDQGQFIVVVSFCAPGEGQLCEPTVEAITETIKFNPASVK